MKPELVALARHRLERARATLAEGSQLFQSQAYDGAVNRFYYAAFYSARALLALKELDSPRHSGVISLFQTHFVKSGALEAEIARALPRAFEKRLKSDYGDFATVTAGEVHDVQREVAAFIEACADVLARLSPNP